MENASRPMPPPALPDLGRRARRRCRGTWLPPAPIYAEFGIGGILPRTRGKDIAAGVSGLVSPTGDGLRFDPNHRADWRIRLVLRVFRGEPSERSGAVLGQDAGGAVEPDPPQ